MDKHIRIFKQDGHWYIQLTTSPIMGDIAWEYDSWQQCWMHANVLLRVWNHI